MTMASWRRRFRAFALMWGVLQFALPLAVLLGDASGALAGRARSAPHVESSTSASCVPAHADECALCRFLSNNSPPLSHGDVPVYGASAAASPTSAPGAPCVVSARRLPESRAPPTVWAT